MLHGQCFIDANAGYTTQALGHLSAESWLAGRLPWWNPYAGVGMPLAAEMQPASFFLPFVLLLHFSDGVLLLKIAMQMVAGLCMAACLRSLRASVAAALVGGLLFQFNGTFAWAADAPTLPVAFLPLLVAGIEISRNRAVEGRTGGIPAVAAGLGFSLLAGFPETAFINGLLAAAWTLMRLFAVPPAARLRFTAKIATGAVIGGCLASPALIPFLDYWQQGSTSLRDVLSVSRLPASQLAVLIMPTLLGPPVHDAITANFLASLRAWDMSGGYICATTLFAGMAALLSLRNHRGLRWLATAWTLFWLAVFTGEPVSRAIWQSIPVLNQVIVTRYALPSIEFLWAILAALAFDQWRSAPLRTLRPACIVFAMACVALGLALADGRVGLGTGYDAPSDSLAVALTGSHYHPMPSWSGVWFAIATVIWTVCIVTGLAMLMGGAATRLRVASVAALLVTDAVIAFVIPMGAGLTGWHLDLSPIRFLAKAPGETRSYSIDDRMQANYGSYFGIATLQSLSLPTPRLWADFAPHISSRLLGFSWHVPLADLGAALAASRAALEAASVQFVVVDRSADPIPTLHDSHFIRVFESPTTNIYRLQQAVPYFQIGSGGPCALDVSSRTELTATCAAPATLIRRELFYPGWHAWVAGRKTSVAGTETIFQQITLERGASRVRFYYSPPHARLILVLLLAGLCGFCLMSIPRGRPEAGYRIFDIRQRRISHSPSYLRQPD